MKALLTHQSYSTSTLVKVVEGKLLQQGTEDEVSQLVLDSRRVGNPQNALFFALPGQTWDGHQFLQDVYDQGVRHFVISKDTNLPVLEEATVIQVNDPLQALQQLAAHHRQQFDCPVIGITGSNGKTIIKEWLYQLMSPDYSVVRSPKSYNSQVGVPLSVWQMGENHNLALFEAGISKAGEMEKLQKMVQPTVGIFTNIGRAHDEGFESREQKVAEKARLFKDVNLLIYRNDYPEIHQEAQKLKKQGVQTLCWSTEGEADFQVSSINTEKGKTTLTLQPPSRDSVTFELPLTDRASIENAVHCIVLLLTFDYSVDTIQERLYRLSPVAMRLEMNQAVNNCTLVNDAYNADINSLRIALDFIGQQQQHPKKTVILSDILQTGQKPEQLYPEVKELLEQKEVNQLIGIGPEIGSQAAVFENGQLQAEFYKSTPEFLNEFLPSRFQDETILLKGARPFEFERISRQLERKIHQTELTINLNHLIDNLNVLRSLVKPSTKVMVMVKAFAYGSGSYEIANVLQFHNVDYLGVAYADGGIALREAGITVPIMVMNPEPGTFGAIINHNLEPEIYSFQLLDNFSQAVRQLYPHLEERVPVHIKLNTGMNRLGFDERDLPQLIKLLKGNKWLRIQSVFSHLAAADEPKHDEFTKGQIEQYQRMVGRLKEALEDDFIEHILNTSGTIRFPDAQLDMVRLGIGMYGVDLTGRIQDQLKQVSTLRTTIAQIRELPKGETVGYSRAGRLERDSVIGVINIGYADGLKRALGNRVGSVLVNGHWAPIVGNVCMDMCMIDLTDVPAEEGDEVIVFGEENPIHKVAAQIDAIPYEILTSISQRVKRVYHYE